jgi:hypothetical protein
MVTGGHFAKVCTTHHHAKNVGCWIEVKAKVIADLNAAKAEIEAKPSYICVPNTQKLNPWSY